MKKFKKQTIVISAASLILSGLAVAEVTQREERHVPNMDTENMTVPEPYLPETRTAPSSWNYNLSDGTYLAANSRGDKMSIRSAQELLRDLGYDLHADGIAGRETKSALRDFQAANGIAQTGSLDKPTVAALRDAASMSDDRYPASFEDEDLPYDSAFPPFPDQRQQTPKPGSAPEPR
jgi:hypothetical protein